MSLFTSVRVVFAFAIFLALQTPLAARTSQSDVPESFKHLTHEQQTACIELDALNRTYSVESIIERLWRLEHKAFMTPSTTSKSVKERINALAQELPPSEEIIEEVRTRLAKPRRGKLPPVLVRDKTGIHEVDASAIDTNSSTRARRTSASAGDYNKLSDELGKLEDTLAKLKKMAQGEDVSDGNDRARPADGSASTGQMQGSDDEGAQESIRDSAASDGASTAESGGTTGGWPSEYNLPGESEARSADKLPDVAFAELQPPQQLAALEIEHHDKIDTGTTESRLRRLENEILGAAYVARGKSEGERLKALNATSPASNLSIKRALKALKAR